MVPSTRALVINQDPIHTSIVATRGDVVRAIAKFTEAHGFLTFRVTNETNGHTVFTPEDLDDERDINLQVIGTRFR